MEKSKKSTINLFFTFNFFIKKKKIFCQKTYLEKLIFLHLCYCFFLRGRLLEMQNYNSNAHIDLHWPCRRRTPTQNTWNRINTLPQILLAMDCYFFFDIFQRKNLQFRKKTKAFAKENFWFTPYKNPDLLTAELFFKLCTSQRYVQNIERN